MVRKVLIFITLITGIFAQRTIDRIIAVVGDRIITQQDIDFTLQNMKQQNPSLDIETKRDELTQYIIDENLLVIKSQLDSVVINEEYVDQQTAQQWGEMVSKFGGEAELEAAYNLPAKKIRKKIKKQVRDKMATEMVSNQFRSKLRVSKSDVEAFYKQYKDSLPEQPEQVEIARILMYPSISDDAMTLVREKALAVIGRLKKGEDFAELAKTLSEGPSGPNGGYLGKVKVGGGFVKQYEDGAMALKKPGDISEPVLSSFGLHVIKLHSKTRDEFETSHILFMAQSTTEDVQSVTTKMKQFRTDIKSGTSTFEEIVKAHSEDNSTKYKKGYLGIFPSAKLPNEKIKNILALMGDNELSDPFEIMDNGKKAIQVIKLIKRIESHKFDLKKDYTSIEQFTLKQKQGKAFQEMIAKLKKEIPIKIYN
jgi:peptidyl-prolyl cis-trans isomerase SurA